MYDIGNHVPPATRQPVPTDNTSRFVIGQVDTWRDTGTLISHDSAREIAAWWQASDADGLPFAAFASTGTITVDLPEAIGNVFEYVQPGPVDTLALRALLAYLRECTVTVWTVGSNPEGFDPDHDQVTVYDDSDPGWLSAVGDLAGRIECAPDDQCGCDCLCDDSETCHACGFDGDVSAILSDRVASYMPTGDESADARRDFTVTLCPDCSGLPVCYWVQRFTGRAGDVLDFPTLP